LIQILQKHNNRFSTSHAGGLNQRDTILITYPDQVQEAGKHPLAVLADVCERFMMDTITGIHILPFYPWTSDDGFSVVDYREVDTHYGDWSDIAKLGNHFRLMFDAVINHVSISSNWFQSMLAGVSHYRDYFVVPKESDDLTHVVRPRALPLLTSYQTAEGEKKIWTTFSADQVDLNYANSKVLLEILDLLLFYVTKGAEFIRLDAIAYLWKEAGTSCINLPQTHRIIQLFRATLDEVAPNVMLITETNVPHADNISYFGDGTNEAQMVYNFSLPPLVLHAFQTGSAETLSRWADSLELPSDKVTFFNFLASHDGIGLNPLRGILPEAEIEEVVSRVQLHGGLVSFKSDVDGTQRPYELNINYFDALNDPNMDEPLDLQIDRFVTAHAILLAMQGVPGIYFHSLVGSRGWLEGVRASGQNRTINRKKFQWDELIRAIEDPNARQARVFFRLRHLLKIRRRHTAFHPHALQKIVYSAPEVFGVLRISPDERDRVLCLQNVSGYQVSLNSLPIPDERFHNPRNLINGKFIEDKELISMEPYQTLWLA
ncbi:MAG TPA: sugar phosphorylase, partial [Anaerolineales bacterium]